MFTSHKFSLLHIYVVLFMAMATRVSCHRCYTCGPTDEDFKINCDNFTSKNQQLFIKTCNTSTGCSIEYESGVAIRRQCEDLALKDCQTANDVKYCYCTAELCNGFNFENGPIDDEDLYGGSGSTENEIVEEQTVVELKPASDANAVYCSLGLLTISILL